MFNKFFLPVFIILLLSGSLIAQKSQTGFLQTPFKIQFNGDALKGVRADGKANTYGLPSVKEFLSGLSDKEQSDSYVSFTFGNTGCTTIYDLCSNGTPVVIWQDPTALDNIHTVFMTAPIGDGTSFPNRRSKYYFSSDRGTTWTYMTDVPVGIKSGFPSIGGFSDGAVLISNHSTDGGTISRCCAYKDAFAGTGSFTHLYPPTYAVNSWPRVISTSGLSIANKFLMLVSEQDSVLYNKCTSLGSTPGTWTGWNFTQGGSAETYAVGRGSDGRIGIAFINNNTLYPSSYGDVWFIESTNNGTTFTPPLKIFDANFGTGGDSLGGLRGISIVYGGNIPCVVFETIKQTTEGTFFPAAPAKIRYWASNLTGSDPNKSIVIADTTKVGYHPYIGVNDVMATLCRPTIGTSSDGTLLFAAFSVPSSEAGGTTDTTSFMDIWFTYTGIVGTGWKNPVKVNPVTPRKDWRYPSITPVSDKSSTYFYCNMTALRGNVPGSYVNGSGNGESAEEFWFIRANITYYPPPIEPYPPVLLAPPNNSTNQPLNVVLDWDSAAGVLSNRIQISQDSYFNSTIYDTSITSRTFLQIRPGILSPNNLYYWRVNSTYSYGTSVWTSPWNFRTGAIGINTVSTEIPGEYKLYNNYPNPFNPSTTIKFDLPKSSAVKLSVYDVTGKEIETLVNEKLNAGPYETKWNGSNYASGVYFCILTANNERLAVRRMILMK